MTAPRQRPILMHARSVRGILEGRKTQTRRIMKDPPDRFNHIGWTEEHGWFLWWDAGGPSEEHSTPSRPIRCPHGQPGDLLYVRENARLELHDCDYWVRYQADQGEVVAEDDGLQWINDPLADEAVGRWVENARWVEEEDGVYVTPWRPGMLVPKALSRLWLRVTEIRVERVQDISPDDILAEGVRAPAEPGLDLHRDTDLRAEWRRLWEDTNGPGAWERNDWVWAVTFERTEAP